MPIEAYVSDAYVDSACRFSAIWFYPRMLVGNVKFLRPLIFGFISLSFFHVLAQQAGQPTQLAPVTVTGSALATIPQANSSAVTVVGGQEVNVGEITSTRDLSAQTPNFMAFDANDQRSPKFSVRGFRENDFGAGESVVGIYVDYVPYFDRYSREQALYEVRRIEFVRGDQGTLYGASGVGGIVNITTRQPGYDSHGYVETSYGNYYSQDYQLGLGGALAQDKLFFNLDGIYELRDVFVYNNFLHAIIPIHKTPKWPRDASLDSQRPVERDIDRQFRPPERWLCLDLSPAG